MGREGRSEWTDDKVDGGKKNLAPPSQIGIRFAGYCMWKNNLEGFSVK